jgi:hypothetical protein
VEAQNLWVFTGYGLLKVWVKAGLTVVSKYSLKLFAALV